MDKNELNSIIKYNEHAIFMAEIALEILKGNQKVLEVKGVKELISTYLLIPYITDKLLDIPSRHHHIPKLDIQKTFVSTGSLNITLDNLRNTICHSFITIEDADEGYMTIDDRAIHDKKTHSNLTDKSRCLRLSLNFAKQKLKELHEEIIRQQNDFNKQLRKDYADGESD